MRFTDFLRNRQAAVAAELALILPGIAFILLNVVDVSSYIWTKMRVDLAAHEAVGFVRATCGDEDGELPATYPANNCSATLDTNMADAAETAISGVTLGTLTEGYYCADADGELHLAGTLENPDDDCSDQVAGSTSKPGNYISVTASYSFSPVFPGASVGSALPATITRTAWIRLE